MNTEEIVLETGRSSRLGRNKKEKERREEKKEEKKRNGTYEALPPPSRWQLSHRTIDHSVRESHSHKPNFIQSHKNIYHCAIPANGGGHSKNTAPCCTR